MTKKPQTSKEAAVKVVKNIRRKTRQTYSAEEKIRIVLAGLRGEESISVLCRPLPPVGSILRMRLSGNGQGHAKHDPERGEGIAESLYYSWSKELLEVGKRRLSIA